MSSLAPDPSTNAPLSHPADPSPLFRPFRIGSLELANRIVMAPMTRNFSPGGRPGADVAQYYGRRAAGRVGLILSEGTAIDRPAAVNHPSIPEFHGDALEGWQAVIDAVHAEGGRMGPQIWHVGAVSVPNADHRPESVESPSGFEAPGKPRGRAMSDNDIADTIAAYAKAAADAERLGFDVAEIHGAHGYLIDQFFWAPTNRRDDRWGGEALVERTRFAVEVVKAMRGAVSPNFPIIIRLSQWKQQDFAARLAASPDEMARWLQPLADAGVDVFHASQRRFWIPEFPEIDGENGLNFAGWAKKLTGKATITVGSVGLAGDFMEAFSGGGSAATGLEALVRRLDREEFDLVAVGRSLIADPHWPEKVRNREPLGRFDAAVLAALE